MPTLTAHAPGTFTWFELASTDQAAARKFYADLFGYEVNDQPIGPEMTYTTFRIGGRDAAALHQMTEAHFPKGTPSHWNAYVTVESADDTAAKVKAAGGKVLSEPFEVMDLGRMTICADPQGAVFCVWQARKHIGVGVKDEHGAFAWCQLNAPPAAREALKKFYGAVFGWTFRDDPMPMGEYYTTWLGADGPRGGMMPMPPGVNAPAHWLIYFASNDVDATVSKTKATGGQVVVPGTDIPGMGRFAVLQDPKGGVFAVVKFLKPSA